MNLANNLLFLILEKIFKISSMITTGKENPTTSIQSPRVNGTVPKTPAKNGTYKMTECNNMEQVTAINNQGLPSMPIWNKEESSLKALIELNISIVTKTERERVDAFCFPRVK